MVKLGSVVQIALGVPELNVSKSFYMRLGLQVLGEGDMPWPWAQLTDGQNLILLNQDGNRYSGLLYFARDAAALVAELEEQGVSFVTKQEHAGQLQQAIFTDPNGLMVSLLNQDASGMFRPDGRPVTRLGKFGEFSIPVQDFEAALAFWTALGFEKLHASTHPYPWGIAGDGLIMLGFHQRTPEAIAAGETFEFTRPTLAYFAPDMADRIASLKAEGLPFSQEMPDGAGKVANAVLRTPEDGRIFLFEGEI